MKKGTGRSLERVLAPVALALSMIFGACAKPAEPETLPPENKYSFTDFRFVTSAAPAVPAAQKKEDIYIGPATRANLGADADLMIKRASEIAQHKRTVILTPSSVIAPGEKPEMDSRLVKLMGPEEMLRRAIRF